MSSRDHKNPQAVSSIQTPYGYRRHRTVRSIIQELDAEKEEEIEERGDEGEHSVSHPSQMDGSDMPWLWKYV